MLNRFVKLGPALAAILLLGACGVPGTPIDMIKPPQSEASVEQHEANKELIKLLPDKVQLVAPAEGEGGKDISFGDMDGDGINEAVVVYTDHQDTGNTLKAVLFKQHNEAWHKVSEVRGFGYGLAYVGFFDADHDGHNELALGWSLGKAGNGLDIYKWNQDELKLLSKKAYQGSFNKLR